MEIKLEIHDIEKIKQARNELNEIIAMNLLKENRMDLTEANIQKAKKIKYVCDKVWIKADIKIVSPDGTELTRIF